jgi:uncharacterized membrane protein
MAAAYVTPGVFVAVAVVLAFLFALGLGWCRCRRRNAAEDEVYPARDLENGHRVYNHGNEPFSYYGKTRTNEKADQP